MPPPRPLSRLGYRAQRRLERGFNVPGEEREKLQEFLEELDRRAARASAATGE